MRTQRYAPELITVIMLGGCAQVIGIEDLPDVPAPDAGDDIDLTRGLVAHWPLDAIEGEPTPITPDVAGGFDGAVSGAATIVPGSVDGALSLDGSSGFVRIADVPELDVTGIITLAAWCRPMATDGIRNIIAHGNSTAPDGEVYLRIIDGEYQGGSWTGASSEAKALVPAGDIGSWVHLAAVYDGVTWRLYRNGLEVATGGSLGAVTVDEAWAIGARGRASPDRFFDGDIDDVRIYDRALSAAEIDELTHFRPR